jgi:hypothetical protein
VRIALHRNTIHLVTARDCLAFRPVLQPVMDRGLTSTFGKRLVDVDLGRLAAVGRRLVEQQPLTFSDLGKLLTEHWPDHEPFALSQGVRQLVPLVQVPPRGVWGSSGQAAHTTAEAWLGADLGTQTSPDEMILRYLAAFGPAGVKDAQVWCGLRRLGEVVKRQRDRLRSYRDENGVELLDLADRELIDADTPVPVRFLPDFDNILLSHTDRTRIMAEEHRGAVFTNNGLIRATVLVDGFVAGRWRIDEKRGTATLTIELFAALTRSQRTQVTEEGERLLAFAAAQSTTREVVVADRV